MGNCTASKIGGGDDKEDVSLCRERKRLLKAAVERRRALAVAHERYVHSLHAVAGAINLFVVRHSAPSPALITLPSSTLPSSSSEPSFLRQTPTEPKTEALFRCSASTSTSSAPTSALSEERKMEMGCGYLFADIPLAPPSPPEVFGWDYFNPFEVLRAAESITGGPYRSLDEDLRAVRKQEGIPELEDEGKEDGQGAKMDFAAMSVEKAVREKEVVVKAADIKEGEGSEGKERGLISMEAPEKRMELLDALKDVEEEFIKSYESGTELSRMLEANRISIQPEDDEIKENSSKFIQAITWNRSSSSSRSYSISSHKDISLTEGRSELFDDYGGMGSGSHSQTIGRLYAWEKKLYEEVKVGGQTRQMYQRKCLQLRNHDSKGSGSRTVDKSRVAAKELYARIWVSLRTIETISLRIQKVRDEELHPQLIELLQGLMRTSRIMLQSHEKQNQIMFDVKTFTCSSYGRYCSDSQRQVTRKLEQQLENWRSCFMAYVAAQRAYVEALGGWLSKCFAPEMKYYCRTISSAPSYKEGSPSPLLLILQEWLSSLMKLPDHAVSLSMKGVVDNMRILLVKQADEQKQKSKVDGLAKEFDHRVAVLQKAENKILESKLSDMKPEAEVRDRVDYLAGRKDLVDMFRQKLEAEKAKHQNCMQETTQATLNGFKVGFANVFESLTEFSRDSLNLYTELLSQNDAVATQKPSCIEDSKVEVDKG